MHRKCLFVAEQFLAHSKASDEYAAQGQIGTYLYYEQNISRLAKKYKIPINNSFGLCELKNLNNPDNISSSEPNIAII